MAFKCTFSFCGLAWVLRNCFCVSVHVKLHPIRNKIMAAGKNMIRSALLCFCFLTTCNSTPNTILYKQQEKAFAFSKY